MPRLSSYSHANHKTTFRTSWQTKAFGNGSVMTRQPWEETNRGKASGLKEANTRRHAVRKGARCSYREPCGPAWKTGGEMRGLRVSGRLPGTDDQRPPQIPAGLAWLLRPLRDPVGVAGVRWLDSPPPAKLCVEAVENQPPPVLGTTATGSQEETGGRYGR